MKHKTTKLYTIRYAKGGSEYLYQFSVNNDADLYFETNKFLTEKEPFALISMTFEERVCA